MNPASAPFHLSPPAVSPADMGFAPAVQHDHRSTPSASSWDTLQGPGHSRAPLPPRPPGGGHSRVARDFVDYVENSYGSFPANNDPTPALLYFNSVVADTVGCAVLPYGSMVSRLCCDGDPASDLDMTLLADYACLQQKNGAETEPVRSLVEKNGGPSLNKAVAWNWGGLRSTTKPPRAEQHTALSDTVHRMRAAGYECVEFVAHGARVPVVKAVCPVTGRRIDITCGNGLAVLNSLLLAMYARNEKVRGFLVALKSWAKQENLIRDKANGFLSSYTWTLWGLSFLFQAQSLVGGIDPAGFGPGHLSISTSTYAPIEYRGLPDISEALRRFMFWFFKRFLNEEAERATVGGTPSASCPVMSIAFAGGLNRSRPLGGWTDIEDPFEADPSRPGLRRVFDCHGATGIGKKIAAQCGWQRIESISIGAGIDSSAVGGAFKNSQREEGKQDEERLAEVVRRQVELNLKRGSRAAAVEQRQSSSGGRSET